MNQEDCTLFLHRSINDQGQPHKVPTDQFFWEGVTEKFWKMLKWALFFSISFFPAA
jgi:hypothetical protein